MKKMVQNLALAQNCSETGLVSTWTEERQQLNTHSPKPQNHFQLHVKTFCGDEIVSAISWTEPQIPPSAIQALLFQINHHQSKFMKDILALEAGVQHFV